jgi:hypothetical protein
VAQFGVVRLDRVGLTLARCDGVLARIVHERVIGREIVGVALGGLRAALHELLQGLCRPFPGDAPAENAARGAVYRRDDIGNVFLWATNVKSSSSSAVSTELDGVGGCSGKASAWAATQLATV